MSKLYPISPPQIKLPQFADDLKRILGEHDCALFQLRLKDAPDAEILKAAEKLRPICTEYKVPFIMNDSVELSIKSGADGVHIGEDDNEITRARELLGNKTIGISCYNSLERALTAADAGADYVSFGAFYPTTTKTPKSKAEITTLREFKKLRPNVKVSAIGGINEQNAKPLIEAGADYICMISAIWKT